MIRFAQSSVKLADCSIRVAGNVFSLAVRWGNRSTKQSTTTEL